MASTAKKTGEVTAFFIETWPIWVGGGAVLLIGFAIFEFFNTASGSGGSGSSSYQSQAQGALLSAAAAMNPIGSAALLGAAL